MAAELNNISKDITDSIRDAVDKKTKLTIKRLVYQDGLKEKLEKKVLALSTCRAFIFSTKVPCRLEYSFNYLNIDSIESKTLHQLSITVKGKPLLFHSVEDDASDIDAFAHMISHIGISLKNVFMTTPLSKLIKKLEVTPAERIKTMHKMIKDIEGREKGPCDNYSQIYNFVCDKYGFIFREDVAWDVDTIYLSQGNKEFCLVDFDHLESRELIPVIGALRFNEWFTKLNATDTKMSIGAMNEINKVVKKNCTIKELHLGGVGLKWEFAHKLSMALLFNTESCLDIIDLSDNNIEDRGIIHLASPLAKMSKGLVSLNLSKCGLTARGINRLVDSLAMNNLVINNLKKLDLSKNSLKTEEITGLCNFLAKPNVITHLNLADTECPLDMVCAALLRGCTQSLRHLNLSGNSFTFSNKTKTKEVNVPITWKQFFSSALSLQHIDLSNNRLPPEALKDLLNGISSNTALEEVKLKINGNDFHRPGAEVIESMIGSLNNVISLDISDNGLDIDMVPILNKISDNRKLKELAIGKNFGSNKSRNISAVLDSVVHLIQDDNCPITSLSLAGSKLKLDTAIIINALGSNISLRKLDISGNYMGDVGARMLAKALMINHKLETVYWDRNHTSHQGFKDVANALEGNYTLRYMPTPVHDASDALKNNPEKTLAVLERIEALLHRNHSPRKFNSEKSYRLHHGFLVNSTQQVIDKLVVQLQDTINAFSDDCSESTARQIEAAQKILKDADSARQILLSLQKVAHESEERGTVIDENLAKVGIDLQELLKTNIKNNLEEMLRAVREQCPAIMEDERFCELINTTCEEKITLREELVHDLLVEQVGTDLTNKIGEVNLSLANYLSDKVMDNVLESLTTHHRILKDHLNARISAKKELDGTTFIINKESLDNEISTDQRRRSIKAAKVRPQSIMDIMETSLYEKSEHELEEKNSSGPTPVPVSASASSSRRHNTDTDVLDHASHFSSMNHLGDSAEDLPVFDDGGALPVVSQKLQHLQKARPKRPRTHAPTKSVQIPSDDKNITDELKQSEGVDTFFERPSEPVSVPMVTAVVKQPPQKPKPPNKKPSFLMSRTSKKEDQVHEKAEEKSKEKSESRGFKMPKIFHTKKKSEVKQPEIDDRKVATEEAKAPGELDKPDPKEEQKNEEEIELRKPAPVIKVGFGAGIIAEMKTKTLKSGAEGEQKEKTPAPPRPDSAPKPAPRASRISVIPESKPSHPKKKKVPTATLR